MQKSEWKTNAHSAGIDRISDIAATNLRLCKWVPACEAVEKLTIRMLIDENQQKRGLATRIPAAPVPVFAATRLISTASCAGMRPGGDAGAIGATANLLKLSGHLNGNDEKQGLAQGFSGHHRVEKTGTGTAAKKRCQSPFFLCFPSEKLCLYLLFIYHPLSLSNLNKWILLFIKYRNPHDRRSPWFLFFSFRFCCCLNLSSFVFTRNPKPETRDPAIMNPRNLCNPWLPLFSMLSVSLCCMSLVFVCYLKPESRPLCLPGTGAHFCAGKNSVCEIFQKKFFWRVKISRYVGE